MFIHYYPDDGSVAQQEREHLRENDLGDGSELSECQTSSDTSGISGLWQRTERVAMKILKLFGYREKQLAIEEALEEACEIRIEADKQLRKFRSTLDGEDFWFSRGMKDDHTKPVNQ
jgi:hypothetical protein